MYSRPSNIRWGGIFLLALFLCLPASSTLAQQGTLFIEGDKVGIHDSTPQADLDMRSQEKASNAIRVIGTDGNIIFRVFEMSGGDGLISLFDNQGTETFRFTSAVGGRIAVGCSQVLSSDLELNDGSGGRFCGTGTYSRANAGDTQFTTSSSRTIKEDLQPVTPEGILEKVANVGVYTYDFIDGPRDRIGLMAEDFHRVLERGAETELNGHEVQMALWLAVQELIARTDELTESNAELTAKNEELRRELGSLRNGTK